jgi:hypothetical protein
MAAELLTLLSFQGLPAHQQRAESSLYEFESPLSAADFRASRE